MKDLTILIKKLGHSVEEIRLRSLQSILSKLELGLLHESELLQQDGIFSRLVEWFGFDTVPEQHKVLQLILRLIKTEEGTGAQFLLRADPGLYHLRQVKGHDAILQDIINGTSHIYSHGNSVSGEEQDSGKKMLKSVDIKYSEPADNKLQTSTETESNDLLLCFHIWSLPEVPLVSGDLNVLNAVEVSLHDPTISEKSCYFFSTVVLQDFPPETFLHHPGIIKALLDLVSEAPPVNTAAVKCLCDFTLALHTQLNYHCDPATASLKHTVCQVSERDEDNAPECGAMGNATLNVNSYHDKDHNQRSRPSELKLSQISIPQFCVITLHYVASLCGSCQNIGFPLMPRLLRLLKACLADAKLMWTSQNFVIRDLIQYIYETMVKLGHAIKQSIVQEPIMRIHLITVTTQLLKAIVPLNIATSVVPSILKEAVTSCVLDPVVTISYPHLHKLFCKYDTACKVDGESLYNDAKRVTDSMQSTIQFIRKADTVTATEGLALFEASLLSLPFHKQLNMIYMFVQLCIEKWKLTNKETEMASRIICVLLAHTETDIVLETYKVVHKTVTFLLGPEQTVKVLDPTVQLSFILTTSVFTEIVCHGTTHDDAQVQQYACDILTYILKCRMLMSETSWLKLLSDMSPVLPLLQCHAGKTTPLQRTVVNLLDPDISKTIGLSELQVISGNIRLMFSKDPTCREEGVARLVWLLNLGGSVHKNLADICIIEKCLTSKQLVVNVYDTGSIVRVLEVLTGIGVDNRVCQSALTQISVMTEDPQLHSIFLEHHGLPVLLKILTSSMENIETANDYVIPIVTTMKNLSRHNAKVREELSQNVTFYCNILKALFRLSEWRLQRDGTQLLALLVFADYIIGTVDYISYPQIVVDKMHLPFDTKCHWSVSVNVQPTLRGVLLGNKETQNILSLQWAIAREAIHSVLNWSQPPTDLPKDLALPKYVLSSLQQSSIKLNCNSLLHAIQNATTHNAAINAISDLYRYIELSWMCKAGELSQLPWQETFSRFVLSSPSCLQDYQLLLMVLRFLTFLAGIQKDQASWIKHSLCEVPHALIKLLVDAGISATSQEDSFHDLWKEVCLEVLSLSEVCMKSGEVKGWDTLINTIVHCLDSSRRKNFYCLALLDRRLRCLQIQLPSHPVDSSILWQLITAFHCDNELSCMGLSITKHTLFCLNCLLTVNTYSLQNWEDHWIKSENMRWLPSLWKSRDILVRASTLQLIAGLCISSRGTMLVSKYLASIWEDCLGFVVDQTEASLVREQAAVLLTNISRHTEQQEIRKVYMKMIEESGLYQELAIAVTQVTLEPKIEFELTLHLPNCYLPVSPRQETTDSELTDAELLPTTPGFIKAGCFLLNNIITLSEECIKYINLHGLSKVLFKCLLEQRKLVNEESLEMLSAIMYLLCYCVETYDSIPVDSANTLINFLESSFIDGLRQESNIQEELVKRFYQETWKLLAVIVAHNKTSVSLSKGVVDTLCECLTQTDSVALKQTVILVIPSVASIIPTDLSGCVCKALLTHWDSCTQKKKLDLLKAVSCLVEQSQEATVVTLQEGLLQHLIKLLKHTIVAFTVDAGVILKSTKGNSSLNNMILYFNTINNFMAGSTQVKLAAEQLELADIVHKLWVWCQTDTKIIVAALNMLITFTANCPQAARSLAMTSTMAGVGQRKSPSSLSLVHAVIYLLTKELHPLIVCKHALLLLSHLCQASECRTIISKSTLLQKLVNALQDKKQIGKETECTWLQFLKVFTYFTEGQHCVTETEELFELLLKQAVTSNHSRSRVLATFVIHNVTFSLSNRTRLLTSKSFLKFVCEKLLTGESEEKEYVSIIIWSLIANNQKAKILFRNLQVLNHIQLASATQACEVFGVVKSLLENDSNS